MSKFTIGADEVGYGCWAGSLYVAAVKAPKDWSLKGLNDSKKLSEKRRNEMESKLRDLIEKKDISWALSISSAKEIDTNGLADCLKLCYGTVISQLYCEDSEVILDGTLKATELKRVMGKYGGAWSMDLTKFRTEVKADGKFATVMAASIMGKTARDADMKVIQHGFYPQYGFDKHVGYGTKEHQDALQKYGVCDIHRKSYKPIQSIMAHRVLDEILKK